jgi:hypothetical protein
MADHPALSAAAWALLVAGVLGSAVNDSGLAVAGAVMAIAWPAFFLLGPGPEAAVGRLARRPRHQESRALARP